MTDIDTLLERLRTVATGHTSSEVAERVAIRPWPPSGHTGAKQVLLDTWATSRSSAIGQFLTVEAEDFVELAFLSSLGRAADAAGRRYYLGQLQQGVPRLEVLAQLAGSPESIKYRGKANWPLWLRPMLWGLRLPSAFVRRASRAVLRRMERQVGRRASYAACGLTWRLADAIDNRDQLWQADIDTTSRDLGACSERLTTIEERLTAADGALSSQLTRLGADFDASLKTLAALRARIATIDYSSSSYAECRPTAKSSGALADTDGLARYYLALESVFRGDPDRIRAQLETDYLQFLIDAKTAAGDGRCVDLGCGRGEWLDILEAHGFDAQGIDLNPVMAEAARARGHEVVVGDALALLRAMPADSRLAISAFHLAEHFDFSTLFHLLAECRRVLKPRGLLILETPNPENIWVATHTFHHDPTHSQPLTPASLEFLVNHHGLETVAVLRLHPYPDEARLPGNDPASERLNAMTCGGQDFAIVASKTPVE